MLGFKGKQTQFAGRNAAATARAARGVKGIAPKLGKVASVQALLVVEIDELAISGCAAERQSILAALKMATLQDAVRSFVIFKPLS